MKICIISPTFPPKVCGIGDYTYKLTMELVKLGIEITVITNEDKDIKEKFAQTKNPKVLSVIRDWDFKSLFILLRLIKTEKPDIVHIQYQTNLYQSRQMVNFLPFFLSLFVKSKLIVTVHELQHPRFLPFTDSFSKFNMFALLFFSHKIIVTSQMQLRKIPDLIGLKSKIEIIPVGSTVDVFPVSQEERERLRQNLNISREETLLINFGMIRPDKGLETLLKAFKCVISEGFKVKLILAGARPNNYWDEYRMGIFKLIEDLGIRTHIIDTGYYSEKKISHLLSVSDLSVLPYKEGVSTKRGPLAMNILHNLPIITTKNKWLPTFLEDGKNIILVEPDNPEELKLKIIDLIKNPDLRLKVKENSKTLVAYLNWENISSFHLKMYEKLCRRKLLVIAMGFPPLIGGVEKLTYQISKNFKALEPIVLTSRESNSKNFDLKQNFKIFRFLQSKKGAIRLILFGIYSIFIAIKERPQAVFCSNIHHDAFCAMLIKKLFHIPYVAYVYDMHDLLPILRKRKFAQFMLKTNIKNAAYLFTISNFTKSMVQNFAPSKEVFVMNPGVDINEYNPQIDAREIVQRYNLRNKRVLLSVCRLVEFKGIDKVIEAVSLVKKCFGNLVYLVIGDGQDKARLEELSLRYQLRGSVFFLGEIPDAQLPQYYAASDIFVMPSRKTEAGLVLEGFGISFIEAAACGKPCIGGKTGGTADAISDGSTGILVNPLDTQEIANAIIELLDNDALREKMGRDARERAVQYFSWEKLFSDIENKFMEII